MCACFHYDGEGDTENKALKNLRVEEKSAREDDTELSIPDDMFALMAHLIEIGCWTILFVTCAKTRVRGPANHTHSAAT